MVNYAYTQIETYSTSDFPEFWVFPASSVGSEGEELWYSYFPVNLSGLSYFTSMDYHLVTGQSVMTTAYIYQSTDNSVHPYAYAFFETGNYSVIDGELAPVYMVIVAKYLSTDTLNYNRHTFVNSVAYYGVAYYCYNQGSGGEFLAERLYLGYVPSDTSITSSGILKTLFEIGQFLVERTSDFLSLLNMRVLGLRLWQILFGGSFTVFAAYAIVKWLIPF